MAQHCCGTSDGCPRLARAEINLRQLTRDSLAEYQCRQAAKGDDADHIGKRSAVLNVGRFCCVIGLRGDRYLLVRVFYLIFYRAPGALNPEY